ncbi:conserved hypothetical protein [Histoplasma capsulatum H143]|uniref:Uncharacterized protein n=1 Tax=Ajellomyces capsulatus (strain H143) TaxID=544712 RepID=C6HD04_AJECH|nr:conserved hypothetical protein [Histoplasma capsulatum H143]
MLSTLNRLSNSLPSAARLPTPRTSALLLLSILPLAAPAACLLYLRLTTVRYITSSTGRYRRPPTVDKSKSSAPSSSTSSTPPHLPLPPLTLPAHLTTSPAHTIIYERVTSLPIPLSSLNSAASTPATTTTTTPALLTTYLRTTMKVFSRTPQAYVIRSALKGNPAHATFDDACIDALEFVPGDRVNGAYVVTYRGEGPEQDGSGSRGGKNSADWCERVEMRLETPAGYTGPGQDVEGVIVVGVEGVGEGEQGGILLVNETWMWRGQAEKPVMLEGVVGRWLHGLFAGWLVVKGMRAITV